MLSRGHYFLFHGSNKDLERDPRGKSYRATTSFSTNVFGTIYMPSSSTFPLAVRCPEYPCISVNSLLAVNRTSVNQIPYFVHWQLSLCTDQTNLCTLGFTSNIHIIHSMINPHLPIATAASPCWPSQPARPPVVAWSMDWPRRPGMRRRRSGPMQCHPPQRLVMLVVG